MPKIHVNDISLYYEIQGKGQPLILIAGFNTDHTIWQDVIGEYAEQFQVIAIDNRGVGQSDCPDYPYTIEMMTDDLVELCKALQMSSAHFMGVSMGGAIAQNIAVKFPDLTRSVVIENSFMQIDARFALFAEARFELMKSGASNKSLIKATLPWVFSNRFLSQPGFVDSFIDLALAKKYPVTEQGYKHQLNALLQFDSNSWISKIKAPCLVVGSDQDMIVCEAHMQQMANQIPNAKYYGFENCGHTPHVEQADIFNRVVLDFLTTHVNS